MPNSNDEQNIIVEVKKPKVRKSEALWLLTFSDLSFVLLAFFVMLLSMSEPKKDRIDEIASEIKKPDKKDPKIENLKSLEKKFKKFIKKNKLEKITEVKLSTKGLSIEFKDAALFSAGSTKPSKKYRTKIAKILRSIAKSPAKYKVNIEGHTDETPIHNKKFNSNWDLASARGLSILNLLKKKGLNESRMSIESFAHTRPKVDITGLKGQELKSARAKNRRVIIRLN